MSSMNIMGTYSGIDMATIDQLIQAESARGTRYTQQKTEYQQEQTAWKDVNGRLDNLYKKLDEFKSSKLFTSKTTKVSSEDSLSVSAKETAITGDYRVSVSQLATATQLTGSKITGKTAKEALNITGSISLKSESNDSNNSEDVKEISIDLTSEMSLLDVRDKINESSDESKVKANIVDNRLILTSTETGDRNIMITGDDATKTALGLDPALQAMENGTDTEAVYSSGKKAVFSIDGLEISKDTNTIDDVIEGVTFTLKNVHEGNETDTVTISEDTEKAADAMQALIGQYNSTVSFIDEKLDVGDPSAENNKTGALSGDSSLTRLQTSLRSMFNRNIESDSESINNLQDLGVEIDRYGVASFNRETFIEKLETNQQDVVDFFHGTKEVQKENAEGVLETETELTGFANEARSLVDEYISSTSGIIKTKSDTYDRLIKDVNKRIETFNTRIETKRQQYIKQFTALDTAMMQAESQLQFMMGQLGGTENG